MAIPNNMMDTAAKTPAVICVFCGSKPGVSPAHLQAARDLAHVFHKENVTLVYGGGTTGLMGELSRTLVSLSGPKAVQGVIPNALIKVENYSPSSSSASSSALNSSSNTPSLSATPSSTSVEVPGSVRRVSKEPERVIKNAASAAGSGTPDLAALLQESEYGITTVVPDMHSRKRLMAERVLNGGPGSGFVVLAGGFGTIEEAMEMTTWNQLGIHQRGIVLLNIEGYWDGLLSWVDKAVDEGFVSKGNKEILVECKNVGEVMDALRRYRLSAERFALDWGVHGEKTV